MSENLRALAVVLALAMGTFVFLRAPAKSMLMSAQDFERRRNAWVAITVAAFLSHNYWLFAAISAAVLYWVASKDRDAAGLTMFVLMAVPLVSVEIPGFAGINYLIDLDYFLIISAVILLPAFLREWRKHPWRYFANTPSDIFLLAYLGLNLMLQVYDNVSLGTPFTGTLRTAVNYFFYALLPYMVISRYARTADSVRAAMASYVVGGAIMAAVGSLEAAKGWLLYHNVGPELGTSSGMSIYLRREGVTLRAVATAEQAIAYGYVMAVGFVFVLGLQSFFAKKIHWLAAVVLFVMGMAASYSRGPWLGAVVGFMTYLALSPHRWSNLGKLLVGALMLSLVLFATPLGDRIYNAVTTESGNYDYRVRVFEVSSRVIRDNPLFGPRNPDYRLELEELRQGQGIIDIVNHYVGVALKSGLVGLFLFVGFFLSAMLAAWKRMHSVASQEMDETTARLGRSLFATLACIMVIIYTVSPISYIPIVYYLVGGLAVAYSRMEAANKIPVAGGEKRKLSRLSGRTSQTRLVIGRW